MPDCSATRRGSFIELVRHFSSRCLVNDTLSPEADLPQAIVHALALVAGPGLLIPFLLIPKYLFLGAMAPRWIPPEVWSDRCFFITYALAVTLVAAALQWDALGPDRRDYAILAPLPIAPLSLYLAPALAQLVFLALFFLAANGGSILLFPAALELGQVEGSGLPQVLAQTGSSLAGCACVFFAVLTLKGILPSLLGPRAGARLAPWLQAGLIGAGALALFLSPQAAWTLPDLENQGGSFPYWLPTLWFVGLQEWWLGSAHPLKAALAATAVRALLAAAAGYLLTWVLVWRRFAALGAGGEPPTAFTPGRGSARLGRWLDRYWLPQPLEQAVFHFCLASLFRSARHRLALAGAAAIAFALSAAQFAVSAPSADPGGAVRLVLVIPLIFSFCLLLGLRHAAAVPAELGANWQFRLHSPLEAQPLWRGCRKFLLVTAVLPPAVVFWPLSAARLGLVPAFAFQAMVLLLGLILREALFLGFRKIPFTCAYLPGKTNLKLTWPLYWAGFSVYVYVPAAASGWLADRVAGWGIVLAIGGVIFWLLRRCRDRQLAHQAEFVFDETPDPAVQRLGLEL